MVLLLPLLTWGGLASCSVGALLALVGVAKGRQARQLSTAVQVDSLAELKQLWALVPILVAVTGRVLSPKPYRCEMSDTDAAIVEMREEKKSERRAGGNAWVADSQLLRETVKESAWALGDGSKAELPVEGGRFADGDYLQMSGDCLIPDNSPQLVRIADGLIGSRSIGVRQAERMLPVGTVLTAVGELSTAVEHPSDFKGAVRRGGKMLVMRQPRDGPFLLSRRPLPEVISSLQASSVACQQWAAAFSALGASMLVAAAAHKAATWLRQRRMRQRIEKALRERRAAAAAGGGAEAAAAAGQTAASDVAGPGVAAAAEGAEEDGDIARGLCVICFDRQPEVVFPSCGHMCACARCGGGLQRCPICRSRGRPIRVFTP